MQSFWSSVRRIQSYVANSGIQPHQNSIYTNACRGLSTSECATGGKGKIIHFLRGKTNCRNPIHPAWINAPVRNLTTDDHPGDDDRSTAAAADTLASRPIKFKRLDKTARHIMTILDKEEVEKVRGSREIPDIKPGHIIQLKVEVPENKSRVSVLKGIVIARRNAGLHSTFRLRRLVAGVGVESVFPLYSPNIKEMKVLDKKDVRRAKLYYLRDRMNILRQNK